MARSLTLLLVLALPAVGPAQGKLDQVREAVNRPDPPSTDRDSADDTSSTTDGSGSAGGDPTGDGFDTLFLLAVGAPWTMPHAALDLGFRVTGRFVPHPYPDPDARVMAFDLPPDGGRSYHERTDTRWWAVRASAEAGSDFSGLNRVGLRLFVDTETRLGLKTDWDWYAEKVWCGCWDTLWVGDVTATYRFVQSEAILMHTGVGARFLVDHGSDRAGINFLYGFDAFPADPVHLFGSFEVGTLGSATVYRLRGGIGVNWAHGEVFAGYDFVRIGGVNLQGPMVGLRLWF